MRERFWNIKKAKNRRCRKRIWR